MTCLGSAVVEYSVEVSDLCGPDVWSCVLLAAVESKKACNTCFGPVKGPRPGTVNVVREIVIVGSLLRMSLY